ncbi:hypothetical protein [Micromonospora cremea]|nr:hypothetical protein [Micromonospora cremea]
MNGRRIVVGGVLLMAGALAAVPAARVLLTGDPDALPIMLFGVAAVAFGAVRLRAGLRLRRHAGWRVACPCRATGTPTPAARRRPTTRPAISFRRETEVPAAATMVRAVITVTAPVEIRVAGPAAATPAVAGPVVVEATPAGVAVAAAPDPVLGQNATYAQ